ncbi:glycosyltransferase family 2 protein [Sulfurovum sp.]|uniref:glycosyltransferase family 2 protein n=1 Tax=Sulfurovum sp. TaxID=1969726 RepID=UPI0025FB66A9|nr:glycosyltransferase family 2 protein [Sulfurovum sp.]
MSKVKYFDSNYSTTRLLTKEKPVIENKTGDKLKSVLFLPEAESRQGEGGLRTKGYFKKSYENKPLITVVTVVFNGEKYLEKTIQSIINQDYDNVEYVIIDGGSTDNTIEIIKRYENQIDYWVSEPDGGIYDAMNKGITLATGEWINFMNTGDLFNNFKIVKLFFSGNLNNYSVLYGDTINMYGDNKCVLDRVHPIETMYKKLPFSHQSTFVRRPLLKRYSFNTDYKICADYDFFYRLYIEKYKFKYLDNIIAHFDMDGVSQNYYKPLKDMKKIVSIYEKDKLYYYDKKLFLKLWVKEMIKMLLPKKVVLSIRNKLAKRRLKDK